MEVEIIPCSDFAKNPFQLRVAPAPSCPLSWCPLIPFPVFSHCTISDLDVHSLHWHFVASCAHRDLRNDIFSTRSHMISQRDRMPANCHAADQSARVIVPLRVVFEGTCRESSRATWPGVKCYKISDARQLQLQQTSLDFLPGIFPLIPSTVHHGCSVSPFTSPGPRRSRFTMA